MTCKFIVDFGHRKLDRSEQEDFEQILWAVQSVQAEFGFVEPSGIEVWEAEADERTTPPLLVYAPGEHEELWAVRASEDFYGDVLSLDPETGETLP